MRDERGTGGAAPGAAGAGEAAGGAERKRPFYAVATPAHLRWTTLIPGPEDLRSPAEILSFCGRLPLEILQEHVSDEAGLCVWCAGHGNPRGYPCGLRTLAVEAVYLQAGRRAAMGNGVIWRLFGDVPPPRRGDQIDCAALWPDDCV